MAVDLLTDARGVLEDLVAGRPPRSPLPSDLAVLRPAARAHGLSGLAGKAILDGSLTVPQDLADGILEDWKSAQRLSAILDLELERIAELRSRWPDPLSPPIILKGSAVAARYQDPSVRPYVDIDILVPLEEIGEWDSLLRANGYEGPTPWECRNAFYVGYAPQYHRAVGGRRIIVELHSQMSTGSRVRPLTYEALAPVTLQTSVGQDVRVARPEAQVMIMAVHLAHHVIEDRRLIWLRDFVELGMERPSIVPEARALALRNGQGRSLERALLAVEGILGSPVWQARPAPTVGLDAEWVRGVPQAGNLNVLALLREMGPGEKLRYVASRFDPRRFRTSTGHFQMGGLQVWIGRQVRRACSTPWWRLVNRGDPG